MKKDGTHQSTEFIVQGFKNYTNQGHINRKGAGC